MTRLRLRPSRLVTLGVLVAVAFDAFAIGVLIWALSRTVEL